MAVTKATLVLNGRNQSGEDIKTSIGYVNPEILDTTDTTLATAERARLKNFAVAINGLTANDLLTVEIQFTEDITQAGE